MWNGGIPFCMLTNSKLTSTIGRKMGSQAAGYVVEKYPKAKPLNKLRAENDFIFTFFVRIIGRLPSDIVSMYMGAIGVKYQKYLSGSILNSADILLTNRVKYFLHYQVQTSFCSFPQATLRQTVPYFRFLLQT